MEMEKTEKEQWVVLSTHKMDDSLGAGEQQIFHRHMA